nr:histidine phosphatase family protein [Rhodococcus sp. HNM0569]
MLFIRHALPEKVTDADERADPALTDEGVRQAELLPAALEPYDIARIVASPQLRARQTAEPLARALDLPVTVFDGLAEYDHGLSHYIPFHEAAALAPDAYARIRAGEFPAFVDADAFRARVFSAIDDVIDAAEHHETVAVVAHGGVVNVYLQELLGLPRPLTFPLEYTSLSRVLVSRDGTRRLASVNETGHVRHLLRR